VINKLGWIVVSAVLLQGGYACARDSSDLSLDDATQLVITETDAAGETKYFLNIELWDKKSEAAWQHASSYPPKFSTEQEHQQTVALVQFLVKAVEGLKAHFESSGELAERAANTYRMAFNLDISDVLQQRDSAKRYYQLALQFKPDDARTYWLYGSFLCSAQECQEGIPYLERARDLGSINALRDLALASLDSCNEEARAVGYLQQYLKHFPTDEKSLYLLKALQSGSFVNRNCQQGKN